MRKNGLYLVIISVLLLGLSLEVLTGNNPEIEQENILVVAHRGLHKDHPENSMKSIQACIDNKIDIVEIDVRKSKDGELILIHDEVIDLVTDSTGRVDEMNYTEIKKLNLLHNGKPVSGYIPKLEEVFESFGDQIILNIDLKLSDTATINKTYSLISNYEIEDNIIFSTGDPELIPYLHSLNPKIRIMPVVYKSKDIRVASSFDYIDLLQVDNRKYSKRIRKVIYEDSTRVWVNALKKYDEMQKENGDGFEKLLSIKKVDYIQTDYPLELLEFLRERDLHN